MRRTPAAAPACRRPRCPHAARTRRAGQALPGSRTLRAARTLHAGRPAWILSRAAAAAFLLALPWLAVGRAGAGDGGGGGGADSLLFTDITSQLPANADNSNAAALGDIDGDIDLDIYVGNGGQTDALYRNDGAGVFTDISSQLPAPTSNASDASLGDVDGDLDLDVLVASGQAEQNLLLLNDGTGAFTDVTSQLPPRLDSTEAGLLLDVDGDGDLDVFAANSGETKALALNDGLGIFTDASTQLPPDTSLTFDAIAFDADGDGDTDVMLANDGEQNVLFLNDGTGTFVDATANLPAVTAATIAVAAADIDGDVDLDLVTANKGETNRLYRNDGMGGFTDATSSLPPDNDASHTVVAADLDGDGDMDLVFGNALQPELLYENTGGGSFVDSSTQIPANADWTEDAQAADMDGDGDADLYLAVRNFQGVGQDHLLRNDSLANPDLVSIAPTSGFVAGGDPVTLTGTGFQNGVVPGSTVVTFAANPAANVTVVDDATLTADTPAATLPGAVDVTLSNSTGADTLPGAFTYLAAPPDLTAVAPALGPVSGGTPVTLTGTGFLTAVLPGSTTVLFDADAATGVSVVSDTTITATSPAKTTDTGTPGAVDVIVTNSNGQDTLPAAFTYFAAVSVGAVSPATGSLSGGDTVTIAGAGFLTGVAAGSTSVSFGGVAAASFTVDTDAQITAVTPAAAAAGPADVTVSNANGTDTLAGGFTYTAPLAIASIVPSLGPVAGGTMVSITGAGFLFGVPPGSLAVAFGAVPSPSVTVLSDTALAVQTPAAAAAGPMDVRITTPAATVSATGGFTYLAPLALLQVTPSSGRLSGGETITLSGSGFFWGVLPGSTTATFGGVPASSLTVDSDTQITATAPAGPGLGTFDVAVTNSQGTVTLPSSYTYLPNPPVVTSLLPFTGPLAGGTNLVISGSGFQVGVPPGTTTVTFGGIPAAFVSVASDTALVAITPPGTVQGAVDVTVTNPNGSFTKPGGFTYGPAITLSAPPKIGTTVQTNFFDQIGHGYVSWMGLGQLSVPITVGTFQGTFCLDASLPLIPTCSGILTTNATPCSVLPIPNNPLLVGLSLYQQGLSGPNLIGGVATFTNCLQITFQP